MYVEILILLMFNITYQNNKQTKAKEIVTNLEINKIVLML